MRRRRRRVCTLHTTARDQSADTAAATEAAAELERVVCQTTVHLISSRSHGCLHAAAA